MLYYFANSVVMLCKVLSKDDCKVVVVMFLFVYSFVSMLRQVVELTRVLNNM